MKKKAKAEKYVIPEKYVSYAERIPRSYADRLVQLKLIKNSDLGISSQSPNKLSSQK